MSETAVATESQEQHDGDLFMVPLTRIRVPDNALRTVKRDTVEYQQLLDSIRERNVLQSVLLRPDEDEGFYILIDGLQRFSCSQDLGKVDIPARLSTADEAESMELQLITNLNRVETKPAEMSQHLVRILALHPTWTKEELARKLHQSVDWVEKRLNLVKLLPEIQELVDDDAIKLQNAYALSKLPEEEQSNFVQDAMADAANVFLPKVTQRIKEIKDAKNKGRDSEERTWSPSMKLRRVADVKAVFEAVEAGNENDLQGIVEAAAGSFDPKMVAATLAWVLSYDAESQEQARKDHEARQKAAKERAARAKEERERQKQLQAEQDARDITKL